jgi:hypothetical protein
MCEEDNWILIRRVIFTNTMGSDFKSARDIRNTGNILFGEKLEWKRDWQQMRRRKEMRDKCVSWIQLAHDGAVVKRVMNAPTL